MLESKKNARKIEDEKFQRIVYVKNQLEEYIDLIDVMNSAYKKTIIDKPLGNVLRKETAAIQSSSFFFHFESR